MAVIDRWSLYRNTVTNNLLIKWSLCTAFRKKSACQIWCENYLGRNQPFIEFVEPANNFMKLVEVGKHFTKFVKFVNNVTQFVEFVSNFTKFVELASNFMKYLGLASKFYEVCRSCEQLYKVSRTEKKLCKVHKICKQLYENLQTTSQSLCDLPVTFGKSVRPAKTLWSFWIGKSDSSAWKFFLYLSFTCSNIFLDKHKEQVIQSEKKLQDLGHVEITYNLSNDLQIMSHTKFHTLTRSVES